MRISYVSGVSLAFVAMIALPAVAGTVTGSFKTGDAAIAKKDFAAIKSRLSAENIDILVEDYNSDQENLDSMIGILDIWLPKKMKFLSGTVSDSQAVLELQGEPYAGTRMIYLARMQRTVDGWLFDGAVPAGFMK